MKTRREILKASAAFMGALGAFGLLGGKTFAAEKPPMKAKVVAANAKTLRAIFDKALTTGDMNKALPEFEGKISPEQKNALMKLNAEDLKALGNIKGKLAGVADRLSGNEGGIIY